MEDKNVELWDEPDNFSALVSPMQLHAIKDLLQGSFKGLIDLLEDIKAGNSSVSQHVIDLLWRLENKDSHLNYWLLDNSKERPKRSAGRPQKDVALEDYIKDWLIIYVKALKYEVYQEKGVLITTDKALELLSKKWPLPSERSKRYELLRSSEGEILRVW